MSDDERVEEVYVRVGTSLYATKADLIAGGRETECGMTADVSAERLEALERVAEHVADFVAAADTRVGQLIGHDDQYFDSYHDARYPLVVALDALTSLSAPTEGER